MGSIKFGDGNSSSQVGINNGVMNFISKRPEPRPEPLSTVPFPYDPDFVGRDGILDTIHEKLSVPGSIIGLVGLGGVGKTRLVTEYCHQARQQSSDTWIFWVHASTAARCEESLRNLADCAKIPGREDYNVHIFQLFGNWLRDGNIGEWILVLDNVDDDELLRKPLATRTHAQANAENYTSTQPPLRYLLGASNGSIIITSRNKCVALEITGHQKNVVDIQPMDMAEALDLMYHKLDPCAERAELVQLVEELEFMPLAIVQAASYIAHCSPRCSASQYLEKLRQSDRQAMKLLNHEGLHTDRDWEAKNSILLTWQISFDYIRQTRQSAADLLSLMSYFNWQGIPEDLLRLQYTTTNDKSLGSSGGFALSSSGEDIESSSEYEPDDKFESDITMLRDYYFVTTSDNSMVFTMHRLVQLTVRTWLKMYDKDEDWKEQFIKSLYAEFPTGQYEHWKRCRALFPHVKSAMLHRPKSQDCRESWAELLYKGASYAQECGNIPDSREMAYISREQMIKILGLEDKKTLKSTAILAGAYRLEGRWEEAEHLEVQVMEIRETKLGADHPNTLTSMNNLALTYSDQGRWEEAEQLQVQVVETSKTKLGADHPNTLRSINNLASTYHDQGRWEEAEQLFVQVTETRETKLGADHPDTLTSMNNLALMYSDQGRWEEAEQLQMQVMETSKTKLGADHPDTLTSMNNLAVTYSNHGQWEEAEQLFVQVMKTFKTKLGADHPNTLTSMDNLAVTYSNHGRWEEAEQLFVQVMETRKTNLGADHPDTLRSINNLASTYHDQGRWEEAEQLFVQVMETRETKLGADHPDTLTSMNNLASTYSNQARWEEAEQLQVQVVETSKTKLGADHPDTLRSMNNLAHTLWSTGQDKAALLIMAECTQMREQKLGPGHPHTKNSKSALKQWQRRQFSISQSPQLTNPPTESKMENMCQGNS